MRVTILGCGGSNGVPVIGNRWGDCDPAEPRNRRRRASVLLESHDVTVLIDATPDMREQLLAADVHRIDAVLFSHAHADHCHGIDDLREVNRLTNRPLPVYGSAETLDALTSRFSYCFKPLQDPSHGFYRPVLVPTPVTPGIPFPIPPLTLLPIAQDHGYSVSLGFRIGNFAYSTDVLNLDDTAMAALGGLETWVVDCVRIDPHPVHAHLAKVLEWVERLRPRRTWFTHMSNRMDYRHLLATLPEGVAPAYDGQVIETE